jgi:dGTPase
LINPRNEIIDLCTINKRAEYQPYTWEGCVVKIADKIAFLGRDIEDAFTLHFFTPQEFVSETTKIAPELRGLLRKTSQTHLENISNTAIIHGLIMNLIKLSSPQTGLQFSNEYLDLMDSLRKVANVLIYNHPRLRYFKKLANLALSSIFIELYSCYQNRKTIENIRGRLYLAPTLYSSFEDWIVKYTDLAEDEKESLKYKNKVVYNLKNKCEYTRAIIDFISGMTDNFALEVFEELTRFR